MGSEYRDPLFVYVENKKMQYYGTRLSENISRREPEGYLLCLNVPVARTGIQEYLPEELGLERGNYSNSGLVPVYRPEEEVFAPETLASFEGMPVTNDHPAEGVDIDNYKRLEKGHAHNVRRGKGEEHDLLLADLMITDPILIDAILGGKREISCGYTYELCEEDGRYIQRKIRGNHIAVVDAGRAGPRVSIKDKQPTQIPERSKPKMKKSLTKLLARMAKDGDVETVAEFIEEMMGEPEATAEVTAVVVENPETEAAPAAPAAEAAGTTGGEAVVAVPEGREITIDEEALAGVIERLDRLIELLTPAAPAADEDPEDAETAEEIAEAVEEIIEAIGAEEAEAEPEAAAEAVATMVEEILAPEETESSTLEEPGEDGDCGPSSCSNQDTLRQVLTAMRPTLAAMNKKQRRKVCGDIAKQMKNLRGGKDTKSYVALKAASRMRPAEDPKALGQKIMEARNPHYKK